MAIPTAQLASTGIFSNAIVQFSQTGVIGAAYLSVPAFSAANNPMRATVPSGTSVNLSVPTVSDWNTGTGASASAGVAIDLLTEYLPAVSVGGTFSVGFLAGQAGMSYETWVRSAQ